MKMQIRTCLAGPNRGRTGCDPDPEPGRDAGWATGASGGVGGRGQGAGRLGFTLIESIVATFIAAIVLPTIYASLASGFSMIKASREDLRATQVIVQRMEAIRLSPYQLLQNPAAYPTNVTEYYSESGKAAGQGGVPYTVTYTCAPGPSGLPPSYRTNVQVVTVSAAWKVGNVQCRRSMQTYVARYGIRRYVCGN